MLYDIEVEEVRSFRVRYRVEAENEEAAFVLAERGETVEESEADGRYEVVSRCPDTRTIAKAGI